MHSEKILSGLCVFISVTCTYMFFVFAAHSKIPHLPGSQYYISSIKTIVAKYPIDIFPAPPLVMIAWPSILLSNILASIFLFVGCFKFKIFPLKVYIFWIIVMVTTLLWTFSFDREYHVISWMLVLIVLLSASVALTYGCRRSATANTDTNFEAIPVSCRWWFHNVVMGYFGLCASWSAVAFSSTTAYALAYKSSPGMKTAHLNGFFSIETCGTISLLTAMFVQVVWTVADIYFYPTHTKCVSSIYPTFSFFMFGTFLSHYQPNIGLTQNNKICLFLSATSLITFVFKNKLQKKIGRVETKMLKHTE